MTDRIEPVRRTTRGAPAIPPVGRAPKDPDRDRRRGRELASPARPPRREDLAADDGLPHVDVRA